MNEHRPAGGGGGVHTLEVSIQFRHADGGIPGSGVWLIETQMSPREAFALYPAAPALLAALDAALEQTEDGLHSSRCDVQDCWVEQARAALATARATANETEVQA